KNAPFLNEHQFGGTGGGPIWKDHTFFFGSLQRWTQRLLGSGTTITGVPTDAGRQILQQLAGGRPQVQALLRHLPAAPTPRFPCRQLDGNPNLAPCPEASGTAIPFGSLTGVANSPFDNWQWSGRIDHQFAKHQLGGRYLFNDSVKSGDGQATPAGLTTDN